MKLQMLVMFIMSIILILIKLQYISSVASSEENTTPDVGNGTAQQFPSIINLNVGGTHFTTRLSTLLSRSESMLCAMFSGSCPIDRDSDGRYFIDRDGKYFSYILNYLRDPINFVISVETIPPVLVEAEYYQVI